MNEHDAARPTLGRNDRCHCGSGKKYKQCCLSTDEAVDRERRARQAEEAAASAEADEAAEGREDAKTRGGKRKGQRGNTKQPWKRGAQTTAGQQRTLPRKVGS